MENREIKGYEMLANGNTPSSLSKETFLVPSQTSDKKYKVVVKKETSCTCPDFKFRNIECKHIISVKLWLKLRERMIGSVNTLELEKELTDKPACAYCSSLNIKKNGSRKTESGIKQRFLCLDCKKAFIEDKDFAKFKANPKIITLTMDLYYKGLSLRDITDTLNQFFGIQLHHETVRRWIERFTEKMNNYTQQFTPKVSEAWHIDEQMIKSKGELRWVWNVLDENTRFLIANNITNSRYITDAEAIVRKAKEVAKVYPKFIITDKLAGYEKAIKNEFSGWWRKDTRVNHISIVGRRKQVNNNLVERYHGTFRERDKVMRGFKGGEVGISDGFRTYYNFIRPHMSLDTTPAVASGISLDLDRNRWLSLLRKSLNAENQIKG